MRARHILTLTLPCALSQSPPYFCSGAGKTTLLDVLAGRKTTGTIEGSIHVNGAPMSSKVFARTAGFAAQQDIHAPFSTVREALAFSAHLRLSTSVSAKTRAEFVEEIIEVLDMGPVAERFTQTLSCGELKRLTIGVELCANPAILFLDEPTTGLDARAAASVLVSIRRIASSGRTIVCTIHAPSFEVFRAFDDLTALVPISGKGPDAMSLAFHGPIGDRAKDVLAYVRDAFTAAAAASGGSSSEGLASLACAHGENPAESIMSMLPGLVSSFRPSALCKANDALLDKIHVDASPDRAREAAAAAKQARPSLVVQFGLLWLRMSHFIMRNHQWCWGRLACALFIGLFFGALWVGAVCPCGALSFLTLPLPPGLLYLQVEPSSYRNTFTLYAAPGGFVGGSALITLTSGMTQYAPLRTVFYRESSSGLYVSFLYPLSIYLADLPVQCAIALLSMPIFYFMVGYKAAAGPFFWALIDTTLYSCWYGTVRRALWVAAGRY